MCMFNFISNPRLATSEKAMAPHSSTLAWKIPWREEPGGLQSTGSRRVRQDWATEQQQQQTGNMVVPFSPHSAVISILIMMHSSGCLN